MSSYLPGVEGGEREALLLGEAEHGLGLGGVEGRSVGLRQTLLTRFTLLHSSTTIIRRRKIIPALSP